MGKKSKKGTASKKSRHGSVKSRRSSGSKTSDIVANAAKAVSEVASDAMVEDSVKDNTIAAKAVSEVASDAMVDHNVKEDTISAKAVLEVANDELVKDHMNVDIPDGLSASLYLFTPEQRMLAEMLCLPPNNQIHLFEKWTAPQAGSEAEDNQKRQFMNQLERMDRAYSDGGLVRYIRNAKILLEKSKQGLNPLDGWTPSVPQGQIFQLGSSEYAEYEAVGIDELSKCGFILVAGGLGERLGYNGIKLALPVELATGITYLQYYIEIILAIQSRYANKGVKLPLCIMVSNDTIKGTLHLLKENKNFGMDDDQITIVQQGEGVPALLDNQAHIALDPSDMYKVESKPHGTFSMYVYLQIRWP